MSVWLVILILMKLQPCYLFYMRFGLTFLFSFFFYVFFETAYYGEVVWIVIKSPQMWQEHVSNHSLLAR